MRIVGLGLPEILILVLILGMIALYFLPSMIAIARKHSASWGIIAVNTLTAWTLVGWVVCLVWAIFGSSRRSD